MNDDTVTAIAAEYARDVEDQLELHERRACFAGESTFDMYMDTWASLCAAFSIVVCRPVWTLSDMDAGRCTNDELNADHDLIYSALEAADYLIN